MTPSERKRIRKRDSASRDSDCCRKHARGLVPCVVPPVCRNGRAARTHRVGTVVAALSDVPRNHTLRTPSLLVASRRRRPASRQERTTCQRAAGMANPTTHGVARGALARGDEPSRWKRIAPMNNELSLHMGRTHVNRRTGERWEGMMQMSQPRQACGMGERNIARPIMLSACYRYRVCSS